MSLCFCYMCKLAIIWLHDNYKGLDEQTLIVVAHVVLFLLCLSVIHAFDCIETHSFDLCWSFSAPFWYTVKYS